MLEIDTPSRLILYWKRLPPIEAIRNKYPEKGAVIAFPPKRYSVELEDAANASFHINRAKLAQSHFPDRVRKADGFILERPPGWS